MAVQFKRKWFNPLYFIINEIAKDDNVREVNIYGGKSSSKTVSICQFLSKEAYINGASSISFRKESTIIPTTIKHSFSLAQKSMYLNNGFEELDRKFISRINDAEIVLKGMDSSEKAKGVESYKYLYFDELNQFDKQEYEQANISLRGQRGQKVFASWNPVNDLNWVKAEYLDEHNFTDTAKYGTLPCPNSFVQISDCGTIILIKTTYEDNYWIAGRPDGDNGMNNEFGYKDESIIRKYQALATSNANSYKVNVLGEWGKTIYGGEILKNWKTEVHAGFYPYNPKLAVHLIFDENVNPYFPCGFFQTEDVFVDEKQSNGTIAKRKVGTNIFLVHALALKNPLNTVKSMGREIDTKLREWGHKEAVFIGGDPTSQKEDVKQEKGHDFFRLIAGELKQWKPQLKLLSGSPSVRMSTDFFNAILLEEVFGLKFRADMKCRFAILDYENTKEDKNGKVDKTMVLNKATGVREQPWGHFFDLTRYFLCYVFAAEYILYQKGGIDTKVTVGKNHNKNSY